MFKLAVLAFAAVATLAACSQPSVAPGTNNPLLSTPNGNAQSGNNPTLIQSDEITIVSSTEIFAASGQSTMLQVRDATGQIMNPAVVEFTSSQPEQISVDAQGVVTARTRGGSSVITATLKGTSQKSQKRFSVQ